VADPGLRTGAAEAVDDGRDHRTGCAQASCSAGWPNTHIFTYLFDGSRLLSHDSNPYAGMVTKQALRARWEESVKERAKLAPESAVPALDKLLVPIGEQAAEADRNRIREGRRGGRKNLASLSNRRS
jgi:hypothetical protein